MRKARLWEKDPSHQRDTYLVLVESGLEAQLRAQKIAFVDLNRDELSKVPARATYTGMELLAAQSRSYL